MKGRKRKPTALKVLQGNPGKRALPKDEPKPPVVSKHPAPAHFDETTAAYWHLRVNQLGSAEILTELDLGLLEVECDARRDYISARDEVLREGQTLEQVGSTGHASIKRNPAVDIRDRAWKRYVEALRETGSTPSARSRVTKTGEKEELDPFAVYEGGKA